MDRCEHEITSYDLHSHVTCLRFAEPQKTNGGSSRICLEDLTTSLSNIFKPDTVFAINWVTRQYKIDVSVLSAQTRREATKLLKRYQMGHCAC
jgi:hypothetical protein